ncbi:NuoM family protein [Campylobacter sp. US33a]|uniref:complex I subunit 4 family protein n=1 Tax=Campylobacter sp. US33a TaxID=2498120 RepID=UPI0010678646|nr:NADH-quinone oxidoreductase subunit M [Campylobacter sp. US33a]TEY03181.1 NADH-quinone oxidoreductase subunit M [Campylobacter sp. US33a]
MLNVLIFLPLFVAFILLGLKNKNTIKFLSLIASAVILLLNLALFLKYTKGYAFEYQLQSATNYLLNYHIGVDSIALILMLLCSLMVFLSFLCLKIRHKGIFVSLFVLEFAIMGLFSALDALLFYVFWEFSLLPLIYIIGLHSKDYKAGVKFFLYAFAGSILMLVAMIYLAFLNHQVLNIWTFDLIVWQEHISAPEFGVQIWLFLAFFVAFAIKSPLFPFHTWAPKVYAYSPTTASVMLVAFKMAPFGFLRFCLPLFPDASVFLMPFIFALCVVSILYTAFIAYRADDLKELIAYSSISHIGVMLLGIFSLNVFGLTGAIFYMFAHGLVTGALFIMASILRSRYGTLKISYHKALASKGALFAALFAIVLFASISLPLTISFVGEFLVLLGVAKINFIYALLAGLVIILGAIYMLSVFRKMFFMGEESHVSRFTLKTREIIGLSIVVILIFYLGISPSVFLNPIEANVNELLNIMQLKATDQASIEFLSDLKDMSHAK